MDIARKQDLLLHRVSRILSNSTDYTFWDVIFFPLLDKGGIYRYFDPARNLTPTKNEYHFFYRYKICQH
jgi:hypothetical protein